MRQLLDFLNFGKRDDQTKTKADNERSEKPDPASTLIIAGEAVPRAADTHQAGENPGTIAPDPQDAGAKRLDEVVSARRRDRWEAPELDGPEFGGLIERRGVDKRGLMPKKYTPEAPKEHRKRDAANPQAKAGEQSQPATVDEDKLEPTGMFLASLDNSAITLADSGLFKVSDDPEEEPAPDGSIDPYNHRG